MAGLLAQKVNLIKSMKKDVSPTIRDGIPYCSWECPSYQADGQRCAVSGEAITSICNPKAIVMLEEGGSALRKLYRLSFRRCETCLDWKMEDGWMYSDLITKCRKCRGQ